MTVTVSFCGERFEVPDGASFTIGRDADLVVDDNPYLHRQFLRVVDSTGAWWLENIGHRLTATVADQAGQLHAWLAPGARLPLVFAHTIVRFSAGPTTYEIEIELSEPPFVAVNQPAPSDASTTMGHRPLTRDQMLLLVVLAEPSLRQSPAGRSELPTSAAAAARLGWSVHKFNRKLDSVCSKFEHGGVRGLHGSPDALAAGRRARLVEYALAAGVVSAADLVLLDDPTESPSP